MQAIVRGRIGPRWSAYAYGVCGSAIAMAPVLFFGDGLLPALDGERAADDKGPVAITVEAKADEPFSQRVDEALAAALSPHIA